MSQPYLGITLDIIDYYPIDFDYSSFSFIFISEAKDFEREISYFNANQICQKVPINKKDIKYHIKITKNDSLIGISEFVIPSQVVSKKDRVFDKTCSINMTDSIKKLLFGSITNSVPLKISIHCTLQYLGGSNTIDKKDKKDKLTYKPNKTIPKKEEKIKPFTPTKFINSNKTFNVIINSNSGFNNKIEPKNALNNSVNKIPKKGDSFISNLKSSKNQKAQRSSSTERQNQKNQSKKIKSKKKIGKENEKEVKTEQNEINENNSIEINEDNNNNDNIFRKDIIELKNNMNECIKNTLNDNLNEINEKDKMLNIINNNLKSLLNFQSEYYHLINNEITLSHKNNELLKENEEKYRNTIESINKLKEEKNLREIKKDILLHKEKISDFDNNELISLKNKEINIFKDLLSKNKEKENENEKNNSQDKKFLLLFKALKIINNKNPINILLTQSNSTESQRSNLKKIIDKYNKELEIKNSEADTITDNNQSNIKFEYVSSIKPDNIDIKMEQFLKQFYSKHQVPKITFKKTSRNNYEYGTQKIVIKLEGEAIRVRYSGGYLLIDKFIELNAILEENKKKGQKMNNNVKANNKKKQKNKY